MGDVERGESIEVYLEERSVEILWRRDGEEEVIEEWSYHS
jgi:hypothetical protein